MSSYLEIMRIISRKLEAHRGRARAVSGKELAGLAGCSEREVREAVGHMVKVQKKPIGSHPSRGYFWIVDRDDMELATRHLKSRAVDLFERLAALNKMDIFKAAQLTLFEAQRRKDAEV